MPDLRERLSSALGDAYSIERELGGGGMSRVFLAEDVELGRKVVIKVLPPEMAAGVNQDRFRREIKLAAGLQHPHIVPLLRAGSSEDLLWYVMPFIEGESLRAKLAREGELPISDAVRILKEVVDALSYAHEHGVVHRDIKPDNVLLTGKHAVVTDFGVAKAVSASTGGQSLTSMGIALGTPAYMSPEQAAADPHVDHRSDLYAVGAMAYEMLCGHPPFTGATPQAVLSSHVTKAPEPVTTHRETVPQALSELVMRCLLKKPADRWQRADEIMPHLDALLTPSGGMTPTGTQPVGAVEHHEAARRAHPVRVGLLYLLAAIGALAAVYVVMYMAGLPDWVLVVAVGLTLVGLPVMLLTGLHERQRALARSTGVVLETPQGVKRWFTWQRALSGSGLAFAGLAIAAGGFMAMRSLGIGPAATLLTADLLQEGDVVILADFANHTSDSALAATVTEAVRIDLSQSRAVQLMSPDDLAEALQRMEVQAVTLDDALAREVAIREGVKAVIVGDVNPAGAGYVLSAQVVASDDGRTLTGLREGANNASEIIPAIDGLSKGLRERIGESLRDIRSSRPLARVTTPSLEALQSYTSALRIYYTEGDLDKALPSFERAVEVDTSFAAAYSKIATYLFNWGRDPARRDSAMTMAYLLRDRLTERERLDITSKYYWIVLGDRDAGTEAFEAYHERYPEVSQARNNLAVAYNATRRFAEAEALYTSNIERNPRAFESHQGLFSAQMAQDKVEEAVATTAHFELMYPAHSLPAYFHTNIAFDTADYVEARRRIEGLRETHINNVNDRRNTSWWLARLAWVGGHIGEAERYERDRLRVEEQRDLRVAYIQTATRIAWLHLLLREDTARAVTEVQAALGRFALDSIPPANRPYLNLVAFFSYAGQPLQARAFWDAYTTHVPEQARERSRTRVAAAGWLAQLEGDFEESITYFRQAYDKYWGARRTFFELARAYDHLGQSDSALAYYRHYLDTPAAYRVNLDGFWLPAVYKRVGELYEERGDREDALAYYGKFVDLWKDADPELQPVVRDVRGRMAELAGEPRGM